MSSLLRVRQPAAPWTAAPSGPRRGPRPPHGQAGVEAGLGQERLDPGQQLGEAAEYGNSAPPSRTRSMPARAAQMAGSWSKYFSRVRRQQRGLLGLIESLRDRRPILQAKFGALAPAARLLPCARHRGWLPGSAACGRPASVLSRSSSPSICASPARPVAASRRSSDQRSSVSTARPGTTALPSSSPASKSSCSGVTRPSPAAAPRPAVGRCRARPRGAAGCPPWPAAACRWPRPGRRCAQQPLDLAVQQLQHGTDGSRPMPAATILTNAGTDSSA